MQMRLLSLLGAASLMLSFTSAVVAQDRNYPQKQITLIVPFSAGGSTVVVARPTRAGVFASGAGVPGDAIGPTILSSV